MLGCGSAGEARARQWLDRLQALDCNVLISSELQHDSTLRLCQQRHISLVHVSHPQHTTAHLTLTAEGEG